MSEVGSIESVRLENLTFAYENEPPVFENVTFDVPMGANVFVTGTSGSGLSTLLKLLAVMIQPQHGRVLINREDATEMSFEEFLPFRNKIGYSFDFGGLFANRTIRDNLILPLLYHKVCPPDEAEKQAAKLAADFGFERQVHQRPALVSGGLRKLICVLRAFIMRPEMLVMDDPFTGIGADASRKIIGMIHERREAGELKHVFLSSRDEVWPHWLGCATLIIEKGMPHFEEKKGAA